MSVTTEVIRVLCTLVSWVILGYHGVTSDEPDDRVRRIKCVCPREGVRRQHGCHRPLFPRSSGTPRQPCPARLWCTSTRSWQVQTAGTPRTYRARPSRPSIMSDSLPCSASAIELARFVAGRRWPTGRCLRAWPTATVSPCARTPPITVSHHTLGG